METKIIIFGKNVKRTGLAHNIGNVNVEGCQDYPYLGTIMTPTNSFIKCKTHLFKQANKAMWGFLKQVNTQNGGKASTIVKLFYSLVVPVLLYNSEVWGGFMKSKSLHNLEKFKNNLFDESHKHEQLLNRMCKYTLGILKEGSNIAAKGELGIYHLNIEVCIRIIKFFFLLLKLINLKEGNKLIYSAVMECYTLWKCGDKVQIAGYNFLSISNYLEIDEGMTVKNLKTELQKLYRQHFFKTISLSQSCQPCRSQNREVHMPKNFKGPPTGSWGMLPQKILKIKCLRMAIIAF